MAAESSPETAGGRPKRKAAAPPPASEAPAKGGRGKKAKTDGVAPPASKAKKGSVEKKAAGKADEDAAAREQQEADEVDALADEPAENGAADSANQGKLTLPRIIYPPLCVPPADCCLLGVPDGPNAPEPNAQAVVIETTQVEAVITA